MQPLCPVPCSKVGSSPAIDLAPGEDIKAASSHDPDQQRSLKTDGRELGPATPRLKEAVVN
jgi:hypothetical protein